MDDDDDENAEAMPKVVGTVRTVLLFHSVLLHGAFVNDDVLDQ